MIPLPGVLEGVLKGTMRYSGEGALVPAKIGVIRDFQRKLLLVRLFR